MESWAVFAGAALGGGVVFALAAMGDEPVGVAVLDGVGEVAQDVAERGDGFGGEVVGQRETEFRVEGAHRRARLGYGRSSSMARCMCSASTVRCLATAAADRA